MKKVILYRLWSDHNQTTDVLTVVNDSCQPVFACLSIERGDQGNKKNVSRIPKGIYPLKLEFSQRFQMELYEIKEVENRSECKIHSANFWKELNGCIALGLKLKDLNNDGYFDITNSKNTLKAFHQALRGVKETTIEIKEL